MSAITNFLAALFATFRVKNPKVAGIVLLALSVITATAMQGNLLGVLHLEGIVKEIVQWVSLTATALIGGGTATDSGKSGA